LIQGNFRSKSKRKTKVKKIRGQVYTFDKEIGREKTLCSRQLAVGTKKKA